LSTSSLVLGVAAANADRRSILVAGIAGLVAGSMSMAAGEYVSVHSQADTDAADLDKERTELSRDPTGERQELADIYVGRGLTRELAAEVATQLMAHNPLEAHARDELGITDALSARPVQAALSSAVSFAAGASVPLIVCLAAPHAYVIPAVAVASLLCLGVLGAIAARVGGAGLAKGALRVVFWGVLAMAVTLSVSKLFGSKV
jgi:VIT1/CCC1 family predicted Fe2+/Mn2+ transporter